MERQKNEAGGGASLSEHLASALTRAHANRPVSAYLLLAVFIVTVLGTQVVHIRDDPMRLAQFLTINLLFFYLVIAWAIVDCGRIFRSYIREREAAFKHTLGEEAFVQQLRENLDSRDLGCRS